MHLLELPIELIQTILGEAMLVRGLQRALRLRLVNKFFSAEVVRSLGELRMLDKVPVPICSTGNIGVAYLSHRLLSKDTAVSERVDNIRRIASRLALEVADGSGSYANYIKTLSSLAVRRCMSTMERFFGPNHNAQAYLYAQRNFEYELLSAAAYTNKFSMVEELSKDSKNTHVQDGTLGNPYAAAVIGENFAVINHLLKIADLHGRGVVDIWTSQLHIASEIGSSRTVEHLLSSEWNPRSDFDKLSYAPATPDPETFGILTRFKEASLHKSITEKQLATLLWRASMNGWEKMVAHLLQLGAPIDGGHRTMDPSLFAACQLGSEQVVKLLLERHPKTTGHELAVAASRGQLGMVKRLIDYGLDVNAKDAAVWEEWAPPPPSPITSAVRLEHVELFHLVIKHGAALTEEVEVIATWKAKEAGLESMLDLLKEHRIDVDRK